MAGKKHFREVEKWLDKCGYELDHINTKAAWVYVHDTAGELIVQPGMSEQVARRVVRDLQKFVGEYQGKPKRNVDQIRERQQRDREQLAAAADRLKAERVEILARRDRSLAGHAAALTNAEVRAIAERIEQIDLEQREIAALMAAPRTGPNSGTRRAQHQAGSRS